MEELQDGVIRFQTALAHEVREIIARGEALLLPLQQHHMHALVQCGLLKGQGESQVHLGVEGIALVRPVEGQEEQAILLLGQNCEGHV